MDNQWFKINLNDFIEFNPKLSLKKGNVHKKVSMDNLNPFTKKILSFENEEFKGGSKFCNGDTIMARITPCLENGKTSYVDILDEGEIGFGSTEFIVLRAKKNISDSHFIYYLSTTPFFRDIAIKSMVGTSGRQRVQIDALKNLEFLVPPLKEQQKISKILSSLDEKIEINRKINENLEEQAKEIFKRWFVDYEFPNEEGQPYKSSGGEMIESELGLIPRGWEVKKLESIINISNGRRPKNKITLKNRQYCIPIIGSSCITGYTDEFLYNEHVLVIGRVGTHGIVQRFKEKIWVSDNAMVIKSNYYEYTNQILNNICYENLNVGSTQPLITQSDIKKHLIKVPINRLINSFEKIVSSLYEKYYFNECEIQKLSSLRDTLLPKLMTGEIDVSKIDI